MNIKKLLSVVTALAMFMMTTASFGVFAEPGTELAGDIINVTAENAQDVLNGSEGSIDGKTIHFTESIDDVLLLAKPSAFEGSNTEYYKFGTGEKVDWSEDSGSVIGNHATYRRTISDVTFTAEPDVVLAGFKFSATHNYTDGYDYVRGVATGVIDGQSTTCYEYSSLNNISFDGLTISGSVEMGLYLSGDGQFESTKVDGVTFDGCTFTGASVTMDTGAAIKMNADSQYFSNIVVKDCTITNYFQGVYVQGVDGLEVSNNLIDNTTHNAVAMQSSTSNPAKGNVTVKENYITNVSDRAMRLGNVDATADIAINNNIMIDCGDELGQNIAAGTVTDGAAIDLENNYWSGNSVSSELVWLGTNLTAPENAGVIAGNFKGEVLEEYLGEGVELSPDGEITQKAFVTLEADGVTTSYKPDEALAFFAAFQNATEAKVTFEADFTIPAGQHIEVADGQTVTVDFNGHRFIKEDNAANAPIENYGILTLTDTTADRLGGISGENRCVNNYNDLTILGGTYTTTSTSGGTAIRNCNAESVLLVEDCTVSAGFYAVYNYGTATINGGKFENHSCSTCHRPNFAYTFSSEGTLYVHGGEIHGVQGALSICGGYAEIYDGTFYAHACELDSHPEGSVGSSTFYALYVAGEEKEAQCVVYGGDFTSEGKVAAIRVGNSLDGGKKLPANADVKGGSFTATVEGVPALLVDDAIGDAVVSGGTFSTEVSEDYLAEGTEMVASPDGGFTIGELPVVPEGQGTETEPYLISSVGELKWLRDTVNGGDSFEGKYVRLTASLDLSGIDWVPIGNGGTRLAHLVIGKTFAGTFDGYGNTISGLTISKNISGEQQGLFGVLYNATVKNLKLDQVHVEGAGDSVGAAVGAMSGASTVENVEVLSGSVSSASDGAGGVVGRMLAEGTIKDCINSASVTAAANSGVGGIVGKAYYTLEGKEMTISGCVNKGEITSPYAAGGIAGLSAANVINCENTGKITAGTEAGGIVAEQIFYGKVSGNSNSAEVANNGDGGTAYGGIIGWLRYAPVGSSYKNYEIITVTNNKNSAAISAPGATLGTGGIIGSIYNQATVTGNENTAPSITGGVFAAGIVGGPQTADDNQKIDNANIVITNNVSTTTIDKINGDFKDLYVYLNSKNFVSQDNFNAWSAEVGDVKYATFTAALSAAKEGDTITLLADSIAERTLQFPKNIKVDLGGHTLKLAGRMHLEDGTVFTNGSIDFEGFAWDDYYFEDGETVNSGIQTALFYTSGAVKFDNVKISGKNTIRLQAGVVYVNDGSTLTLTNGTEFSITGMDTATGLFANSGDHSAIVVLDNAKVTIEGGTGRGFMGLGVDANNAEISIGDIDSHAFSHIINSSFADTTITVDGAETCFNLDDSLTGEKITISGDSVVKATNITDDAVYNVLNKDQLVIEGGSFSKDPTDYLTEGAGVMFNDKTGLYYVTGTWTVDLTASVTELYAADTVEITVKADGENYSGAEWKLSYDTTKFELVGQKEVDEDKDTASNGVISGRAYDVTTSNAYDSDTELAVYTFKALAQETEVTGAFTLTEASVGTVEISAIGSLPAAEVGAPEEVTILLKDFTVTVMHNDTEVTELPLTIPYDGEEHIILVETEPAATVYYTVNDGTESTTAPVLTEPGTYTITYWVDVPDGYDQTAKAPVTITVTVGEPEYLVEVAAGNYVSGYKLILVYTNTDKAYFNYDGSETLMPDVTAAGYRYVDDSGMESTETYQHVYGYVVPTIMVDDETAADDEAYKAKVQFTTQGTPAVVNPYDYNINCDNAAAADLADVIYITSVYNATDSSMVEAYMKQILKADAFTDADGKRDKKVDMSDITPVKDTWLANDN